MEEAPTPEAFFELVGKVEEMMDGGLDYKMFISKAIAKEFGNLDWDQIDNQALVDLVMDKFRIISGGQAPQEMMDKIRTMISGKTTAADFAMALEEVFAMIPGGDKDDGDQMMEKFAMAYQKVMEGIGR